MRRPTIRVISPYDAQRKLAMQAIKQLPASSYDTSLVDFRTVTSSMGHEYDFVVNLMVRDGNPYGFTSNSDIMVVALIGSCLTSPEFNYGPSELDITWLVWAYKRLRTRLHSDRDAITASTDYESAQGIVDKSAL
jgi:hypothetical protein